MIKWVQLLVALIMMGVSMTGCGRGIFNTEPFVDAEKDERGNVVLRDTPRMWADFRESVDREVSRESGGNFAQGRIPWNDFWLRRIDNMARGSQENAQKYIGYIIESRRRAGLPELEGYLQSSDVQEIDADKFMSFFASQRACMEYADSLVAPSTGMLSSMATPGQMRIWFYENPDDELSRLAARVQKSTLPLGELDPRLESS